MKKLMVLICTVLALTACGGGTDLESGNGYSVAGALHEIPTEDIGEEGSIQVSTADLVTATELAGMERPQDVEDDQRLTEWIGALTALDLERGVPMFVPFAEVFGIRSGSISDVEAELGWSVADVDTFVECNTPPYMFTVVTGDFDENALTTDGLSEMGNGVVSAGEGEDLSSDLENITAARPMGMPLRMAQQDHQIAGSRSTSAVEAWLEGEGETLADNERLLAVAEALDASDVVSAYLVQGRFGLQATERPYPPEVLEELQGQVMTETFDTVGIGWGVDDEGESRIELAYHFSDDAEAESAVPALKTTFEEAEDPQTSRPYAELLVLDEITSDGPVVTATLHPGPEGHVQVVLDMLVNRALPFTHR